jgi:uncharacterized protein with GYD domain
MAQLKAESAATATAKASLVESLKDTKDRLKEVLQAAQQEGTAMRVRYETAEQHRQEAISQYSRQA